MNIQEDKLVKENEKLWVALDQMSDVIINLASILMEVNDIPDAAKLSIDELTKYAKDVQYKILNRTLV